MENTPPPSTPPTIEIPENFPVVLNDFISDLTLTFPEYKYLWEHMPEMAEPIYQYCLGIYPERFFDILYQNDEIFEPTSETNTQFLPNVDFKMLFTTEGITETTKQAIWKYLQLILITIMSGVKDKTGFGESMGLFDGIDESELESKLSETIENLNDFFKHLGVEPDNLDESKFSGENNSDNAGDTTADNEKFAFDLSGAGIPNAAGIHEHLKGLFDGKIGKLAKELAEEFSKEFMGMFGEGEVKNTQDVFKKIMKNPKKLMELMKTISVKIEDKMKRGDISKDEIMKEASELMGKMKEMGGKKEFQNMMKNLTKNMGGLGAAAAAAAGAGGGKTKFNMGAMKRMASEHDQKEKMREKLEKRRAAGGPLSKTAALLQECGDSSFRAPVPVPPPPPMNDDWLDDYDNTPVGSSSSSKSKSSSKKKGKK